MHATLGALSACLAPQNDHRSISVARGKSSPRNAGRCVGQARETIDEQPAGSGNSRSILAGMSKRRREQAARSLPAHGNVAASASNLDLPVKEVAAVMAGLLAALYGAISAASDVTA